MTAKTRGIGNRSNKDSITPLTNSFNNIKAWIHHPEFENRRKREIAEKEKSRAKRAGKKQKRMHESKDLSKNRAINLIFLQKSVDKREDILYNYSST